MRSFQTQRDKHVRSREKTHGKQMAFYAVTPSLLIAGSLMIAGCSGNSGEKTESSAPAQKNSPQEQVPEVISLRVAGPDELQAVLDSHRGKVVLVDFWATWCAPCRKQFPHTVELSREHAAAGFAAISVSCDEADREEEIMAFLKKSGATFDNLRSKHGGNEETFSAFAIEGGALPHYKLYDRTGKLRHTFGADPTAEKQFTSEDIDIRVKELLAEEL